MTQMLSTGALVILLGAATLSAQPAQNPYSTMVKDGWNSLKKNLSASAAKMADADYAFKPTPQVRSFGQILGHLANEHYLICAAVKGEKSQYATTDFEKVTSKAELVAAFDKSIAYCDGAYTSMTDAAGTQPVEVFGEKMMKLAALQTNLTHGSEHYGNLVTYMRLKGVVPPSSTGQSRLALQQRRFAACGILARHAGCIESQPARSAAGLLGPEQHDHRQLAPGRARRDYGRQRDAGQSVHRDVVRAHALRTARLRR